MRRIPTVTAPVNLDDLVKDICMGPPPAGHRVDDAADEATVALLTAARQVGVLLTPIDARILACAATQAALLELAGGRAR